MKNKKLLYLISTFLVTMILSFVIIKYENYIASVNHYFKSSENFKKFVIQNVAIYDDYKSSEIEKELRTYLLMDHLKIASDHKYEQVTNINDLLKLSNEGKLVYVDSAANESYYFYNVAKDLRYLKPFTKDGLELISQRFDKILHEKQINSDLHNDQFKVKFAISSATRPVEYQKNLRSKNENASLESTHSYGISFDIFYDEYFVSDKSDKISFKSKEFEKIRKIHGFALGSALRRQLQSVLSRTLLELQREHKLYAILETNQKCYHVTILP
ncbi:MAG: DUF5715 family protein [Spirochaetia bacterium]|nr:DUF5715 family protein [Spirochaetia bacterium]